MDLKCSYALDLSCPNRQRLEVSENVKFIAVTSRASKLQVSKVGELRDLNPDLPRESVNIFCPNFDGYNPMKSWCLKWMAPCPSWPESSQQTKNWQSISYSSDSSILSFFMRYCMPLSGTLKSEIFKTRWKPKKVRSAISLQRRFWWAIVLFCSWTRSHLPARGPQLSLPLNRPQSLVWEILWKCWYLLYILMV